MRRFMGDLSGWDAHYLLEGRRKPTLYHRDGVSVLGHYESPCGGCDTFKGYPQLQSAVGLAVSMGEVVMEGLMLSDDVKQTVIIHEGYQDQVKVLYLTTPIETCIQRVKQRRAAKGKDDIFNEEKLRNRHEQITRTRDRLLDAGIECYRCSAEQAPGIILKWLGIH